MSLFIHGIGHFHPENEIDNRFLEELDIGTNESWIVERTGIRSRRTVLPLDYLRETHNQNQHAAQEAALYDAGELGRRAAMQALDRAGLEVSDVGMVVAGSSAMDSLSPVEAAYVARSLDIQVPVLDLNSACTSFLAQLHWLSCMRPETLPRYVLIVTPELMTQVVDYKDRTSAVLWGDCAAAAVVSTTEPARARVLGSELTSDPAGADRVKVSRLGYFEQDGRNVQMFAIKKTASGYERLKAEYETEGRRLHFIGHQANLRMLEAVCERCKIEPELHHANAEWFGNTGAASSASVLSQRWEKWRDDDDVAVVGVGAGLTWASYLLRFGDAS